MTDEFDIAEGAKTGLKEAADGEGLTNIEPRKLESVLRIPVVMQVVVGSATMPVANILKLGRGAIIPLDHRIGEPVDIIVNGRVIARGDIVVLEEDKTRFGVSLTEIVTPGRDSDN